MSNPAPKSYADIGFSPYAVIRSRGGVSAIIVSSDSWGCKLMFEAWDGMRSTAVRFANYPWSAVAYGNFRVVG